LQALCHRLAVPELHWDGKARTIYVIFVEMLLADWPPIRQKW
jgi:hypothetical protein